MQGEKQAQIHISRKAPVDKVITRIAQGSKNATRSTITRKTITAPIQASNISKNMIYTVHTFLPAQLVTITPCP